MASIATTWQLYHRQLDEPTSWAHRKALIAIILLGFLLRWYTLYQGHAFNIDNIPDEVSALKYALALLAGDPNAWYLAQPALNQGHIPGPAWTLVVAAFYTLGGHSAEGAIFWMLLMNSVMLYPFYLFASRLLAPRAALFSTLFFALAPWPIYYAAGLYNPLALPLFCVLLFWALWQTLNIDRSRAVFWVLLLTALVMQLHMIGIFYAPVILLLLWLSPTRLNLRWLTAGIIAGVLLYTPYLLGEVTHHWANLRAVLSGHHKFSWGAFKILTIPMEMLTNHPGGWAGDSTAALKDFGNRYFGSYVLLLAINLFSVGFAMLCVYGFVRKFYHVLRHSKFNLKAALLQHRLTVFLGVLLVLPLLLYTLLGKSYASRYSIIIFPLLFLLPALALQRMKSARTRRYVAYALTVMFACNAYLVLAFSVDQHRKLTTASQYLPAFYKLAWLYGALRRDAGPDSSINIDTTRFTVTGKHYNKITRAIHTYIAMYEAHLPPVPTPRRVKHYMLVATPAKLPAKARVVFRDNGLIAYTDK